MALENNQTLVGDHVDVGPFVGEPREREKQLHENQTRADDDLRTWRYVLWTQSALLLRALEDSGDAIRFREQGSVHHRERQTDAEALHDACDNMRSHDNWKGHRITEMYATEHNKTKFFATRFNNGRLPFLVEENDDVQRENVSN